MCVSVYVSVSVHAHVCACVCVCLCLSERVGARLPVCACMFVRVDHCSSSPWRYLAWLISP